MLLSNTIQELSLVFLKGSWGAYARKCQLREVGVEKNAHDSPTIAVAALD